jgi:tripartite-type tricarboxylate transporter receptor subunit TctC
MLHSTRMTTSYRVLGWMAAMLVLGMPPASAQSPDAFYKGKTITFVVGFGPGGGYDLYARIIGHYICFNT